MKEGNTDNVKRYLSSNKINMDITLLSHLLPSFYKICCCHPDDIWFGVPRMIGYWYKCR